MKPTNNSALLTALHSIYVAADIRRLHSASRPHADTVIPTGEPRFSRLVAEGSLFDLNASSDSSSEPRT